MKLFTPNDIRKYFYASCFLAFICLILAVIAIGESGQANLIEEKFSGIGQFDHSSYSKSASDRAMSDGGVIAYEMSRDWQNESAQTFSTSFIVSGAKGGYKDQYVVKASGAGYKHTYQATKISGDFSGSGESTVSMETGVQSLDSLVLMDGNATFRGRIINGQTGKPLTKTEMDAAGEYILRSYLNVSEPIKTPEDWLGFCATFSDALPASVGPAKLIPENATI
ncbi:hypothetical protein M0R72_19040 [Candidatus Pacearchaeota archaeon]|jgi:hypothetical protein|nr:hypothetical protein [Candidatus Pacearchaeota archaeon]